MVSSKVSSRSREREGFRRPSDREDIVYRDRGQLGLSIVGPLLQSHLGVDLAYDVKRGREIGYEGSRCGGARQDGEAAGQGAGGGWSPGAGGGPQGGADARRRG